MKPLDGARTRVSLLPAASAALRFEPPTPVEKATAKEKKEDLEKEKGGRSRVTSAKLQLVWSRSNLHTCFRFRNNPSDGTVPSVPIMALTMPRMNCNE